MATMTATHQILTLGHGSVSTSFVNMAASILSKGRTMAKYASSLERQEPCSKMPERLHSAALTSKVKYDHFSRHPRVRLPAREMASTSSRRRCHIDTTHVPRPWILSGARKASSYPVTLRNMEQLRRKFPLHLDLGWFCPSSSLHLTSSFISFTLFAVAAIPAQPFKAILIPTYRYARTSWESSAWL